MKTSPRFSVVIPTKNRSERLKRALESVLRAKEVEEIIVSDNASTDGTPAVVEDCIARHPARIRSIRSSFDLGMVGNWKQGLAEATGDWILLLCDDDWIEPSLFERALQFIVERPDLSLVAVERTEVPTANIAAGANAHRPNTIRRFPGSANALAERDLLRQFVCRENILGPPSAVLIRTSALENASQKRSVFAESFRYAADWAAWFRLTCEGDVGFLREPLVNVEIHDSNLTHRAVDEGTDLVEVTTLRWMAVERLKTLGEPTFLLSCFLRAAIAYRLARRFIRLAIRGRPGQMASLLTRLRNTRIEARRLA